MEIEGLEEIIDMLVKLGGGEENLSGYVKALYLGVKAGELSRRIEANPKFEHLPDDSEVVQSLIKLRETEIEVLKKILDKMQ